MMKSTAPDLFYNIVEERLFGSLDSKNFDAHAVSGGRAGSKTPGAVNQFLANNPFLTDVKLGAGHPGGPLPMALYTLSCHETRPNWIRLNPDDPLDLGDRAGFAIHGRGQRGSDGCIVPFDFNVVLRLYTLTRARGVAGRAAPSLQVFATGDLGRFEKMARLA